MRTSTGESPSFDPTGAESPARTWALRWTRLIEAMWDERERDRAIYASIEEVRRSPSRFCRPRLPERPARLPERDGDIVELIQAARRGRKLAPEVAAVLSTFGLWRQLVERTEAEAVGRLLTVWWALRHFRRFGLRREAGDIERLLEEGWRLGCEVPQEGLEEERRAWQCCLDLALLPVALRRGQMRGMIGI